MKILITISVFLLLTAAKSSAATGDPDSIGKPLPVKDIQFAVTGRTGSFGRQSFTNISLRAVKYIISPVMIVPAGLTPEIIAKSDSLNTAQLMQIKNDSLKATQYAQKAGEYLHYDTISNKKEKLNYEDQAIGYTLKAIKYYSRYDDTTGLRTSFDVLAKVYHDERKYSQAKWFILQSNTLSRAKHDVPNIISSLLVLATIKADIKDYSLAMRDLNEAMKLADSSHAPKTAATVQFGYVMLYNNMKNYAKANLALKRYNFINDSIQQGVEAKIAKTTDSVQRKKKFYLTSNRRPSRTSSSKKTTLL